MASTVSRGHGANAVSGGFVLRAEGLHKAFGGQIILSGTSVALRAGEIVLLRGENGSGKTTLLNILTGYLRPDVGQIFVNGGSAGGSFTFPRRWWETISPFAQFTPGRMTRAGVSRTWQDIRLFPSQTLLDNVAVAVPNQQGERPSRLLLRPLGAARQEARVRDVAGSALARVGLSGYVNASADRVSLGQAKRAAFVRAVETGARILLLDEPLAGLDDNGVSDILSVLSDLAKTRGLTLVIVEHLFNIPRVLDLATAVWTLRDGLVAVEEPKAVRERMKVEVGHGLSEWLRRSSGLASTAETQRLRGGGAISFFSKAGLEPGEVVLEVDGLLVSRRGRAIMGDQGPDGQLRGLSFKLRRGEIAVLEAQNAWGKTTLLESLVGVLPVTRGRIVLDGIDVTRLEPWARASLGLSMLQSRRNVFDDLTVRESFQVAKVETIPDGLEAFSSRRVSNLSGGEKQRVALACALGMRRLRVALLDEPFSAFDRASMIAAVAQTERSLGDAAVLIAVPAGWAPTQRKERL